ncbi:MAG: DUF2892 domain-containing protein [Syntrophomonadaceae bacterium]|nr:DUF2892 domain-containing protein [Syntrophomonadaceae bacterium]
MISINKNVGSLDRSLRFAVSLFLLGLGLFGSYMPVWQAILLLLGVAELITSITAY